MGDRASELQQRSRSQIDLATIETLSALATVEAYGVTFLGVARQRGGELDLDAAIRRLLRTAQCEHEAHHSFLLAEGGIPQTVAFQLDPAELDIGASILEALIELTGVMQGAYLAATRFFAETWQYRLVEVATQAAAVEAQQRAVARLLTGAELPVDRAFAEWRFRSAIEAVAILDEQVRFAPTDDAVPFPGPLERNCRGVFGLVPETSEDHEV
jgi:hypothetical protein